jgi:hypothetical protein
MKEVYAYIVIGIEMDDESEVRKTTMQRTLNARLHVVCFHRRRLVCCLEYVVCTIPFVYSTTLFYCLTWIRLYSFAPPPPPSPRLALLSAGAVQAAASLPGPPHSTTSTLPRSPTPSSESTASNAGERGVSNGHDRLVRSPPGGLFFSPQKARGSTRRGRWSRRVTWRGRG